MLSDLLVRWQLQYRAVLLITAANAANAVSTVAGSNATNAVSTVAVSAAKNY